MTGGWLTIRYRPSTTSPSLDSACRLSRVCAFSRVFSARLAASLASFASSLALLAFFPFPLSSFSVWATTPRIAAISSSSSMCAYHTSIVGICAKAAMASR
jgi:hypothetical protein